MQNVADSYLHASNKANDIYRVYRLQYYFVFLNEAERIYTDVNIRNELCSGARLLWVVKFPMHSWFLDAIQKEEMINGVGVECGNRNGTSTVNIRPPTTRDW